MEILKAVKPHALFGLSGSGRAFFQDTVEALCEGHPAPLIFPLSNPVRLTAVPAPPPLRPALGAAAAQSPLRPFSFSFSRASPPESLIVTQGGMTAGVRLALPEAAGHHLSPSAATARKCGAGSLPKRLDPAAARFPKAR